MPAPQKIKDLLLQTIFKKAKWETARILVKSPKNRDKEIEDISVLHMWQMLLPKVHEEVSKEWKRATGQSIPVTLKDVLEAAERARAS